jgi:membrane fusion protein, multidrug efflux system
MQLKTLAIGAALAIAAIAATNQAGVPVPGLEWLRLDTALTKLGLGNQTTADAGSVASDAKRGKRGGGGKWGADGPVPIVAAPVAVSDVPVYLRGVGTVRALNTVTVRPQIDGRLVKVHFREGQDVKRGDLLAEIDPITFQAQLDQAVAKKALTQAQLANARLDLERYGKVGPGVVAQKTVDTQRAQVAQFEAQLKSDEAAIANTEAILGYARITAPIDGRTGQRLVDEGNLVRAGDVGIVTIAEIRPIAVQFTLPQQQLAQVVTSQGAGPVPVEAMASDDKSAIDTGNLSFIDNQIDQTTGTVKMKADLPNATLALWPGQFVNVRVRVDVLRQVISVPTAAIQRGPQGPFVYVIKTGDKTSVGMRLVTVAQQDDKIAVVTKGLTADDRVATSGFARLKDDTEVSVSQGETAPSATSPQAPPSAARTSNAVGEPSAPVDTKTKPERRQKAEGEGRRERRNKPPESTVQ